jgi:hypothetical protein
MARGGGSQARGFLVAGGGLLALAAFFLWRDLALSPEYLLTAAAIACAALALGARARLTAYAGVGGLLACAAGGGAWYAAVRSDALLPGLALALVGAALTAALKLRRAEAEGDVTGERLTWSALAAAALAASWAGYFRFLTLGFAAEHVGRRLVLTLAWLACGLLLAIARQRREGDPARWAGYAFVIAAVAKAVGYDTTHLAGWLRISVLAAAGTLLLVGGWWSARAHVERELASEVPDTGGAS